jgi:uncharacterized protein YigA (DUF484 family)
VPLEEPEPVEATSKPVMSVNEQVLSLKAELSMRCEELRRARSEIAYLTTEVAAAEQLRARIRALENELVKVHESANHYDTMTAILKRKFALPC